MAQRHFPAMPMPRHRENYESTSNDGEGLTADTLRRYLRTTSDGQRGGR
jgi:hypothetical protein